uniref:Uncharacterized protein n=1 Tax=Setaria digitata TaxID=48799 RepID=A0A915PCY1_9BILA
MKDNGCAVEVTWSSGQTDGRRAPRKRVPTKTTRNEGSILRAEVAQCSAAPVVQLGDWTVKQATRR